MKDEVMLAKWLNNELDEKELKAFMASPEFDTYNKIKEYSAQLTVPEVDMDTLYAGIEHRKNKAVKVRTLNPWFTRIAAMLVLFLGATFFLYTTHTTTQIADTGKRTEFLLPDNSTVLLNAGSEADYKTWNWKNNRKLQLDGEAYFKVAKGQTFDVVTPMGKVTVVGTQFNVKARGSRFDVTCFEGKVRVTSSDNQILLLLPGESIAFEKGKKIEVPMDKKSQPGWLSNEADFYKESLSNVIKEIERQYNVEITVNTALPAERFTGTIPTNDINTALELIEAPYHLKSKKAGNKITLSTE